MYVSQAEAARIIGTTNQTVANLIRRDVFATKEIAGRILVLRSEAESYVKRPKGRPSKKQAAESEQRKKPSKAKVLATDRTDKYISQAEAARIRGVSDQAIANLIRRNRLSTKTIAGRVVVLLSDVVSFTPKAPGVRPRSKTSKKEKSNK